MNLPEGFQPVHSYLTGEPVPVPTLASYGVVPRVWYTFEISGGFPTLPLKTYGEIKHDNRRAPFRFAVGADGQAWLDDAQGGPLKAVDHGDLLSTTKDEHTENKLRAALGLPPRSPAWMAEALAHGWAPPEKVDALWAAIEQANEHLFDADLHDPEHQIEAHADTLPEAYRRVCAAASKALEALQVVIREAVGG